MTTMNADLPDALKAAGVDDALARRAAESVVGRDAGPRRGDVDLFDMKSTLRLHSWMLGAVIALQVGILLRLLA